MDILDQLTRPPAKENMRGSISTTHAVHSSKRHHPSNLTLTQNNENIIDPVEKTSNSIFGSQKSGFFSRGSIPDMPFASSQMMGDKIHLSRKTDEMGSNLCIIPSEEGESSRKELKEQVDKSRRNNRQRNRDTGSLHKGQEVVEPNKIESIDKERKYTERQVEKIKEQLQWYKQEGQRIKKTLEDDRNRYELQKRKLMEESQATLEKYKQRMSQEYGDQLERREKLLRWEAQTKEQSYKDSLECLQSVVQQYKKSLSEKASFSHPVQSNQQSSSKNGNILEREMLLKKQSDELQQQYNELYAAKSQFEKLKANERSIVEGERDRSFKELRKRSEELSLKEEKLAKQRHDIMRNIQKERRSLQQKMQETDLIKQCLEKERENYRKLHQKFIDEFKARNQQLTSQKAKVYSLEAELIKKLSVLQQYSQKSQKNIQLKQSSNIEEIQQKNESEEKPQQLKSTVKYENLKTNVGKYLGDMKSKKQTRGIYKLQDFYQQC